MLMLGLIILGLGLYYSSLKIIKKFDNEDLKINKNVVASIIVTTLCLYQINNTVEGIFNIVFSQFLIITAYIDYKTKYVYTMLNLVMALILIGYYTYNSFELPSGNLIILTMFSLLILIMGKLNFFGDGDKELYILIGFFFSIVYSGDLMSLLILDMFIANLIFIIFNIKDVINYLKYKKSKTKKAFVPYMAIASIFLIVLC